MLTCMPCKLVYILVTSSRTSFKRKASGLEIKTEVLTDNYAPDWSKTTIAITTAVAAPQDLMSAHVLINCRDHDYVGSDNPLGSAALSLDDVVTANADGEKAYTARLPMMWLGKHVGEITAVVALEAPSASASVRCLNHTSSSSLELPGKQVQLSSSTASPPPPLKKADEEEGGAAVGARKRGGEGPTAEDSTAVSLETLSSTAPSTAQTRQQEGWTLAASGAHACFFVESPQATPNGTRLCHNIMQDGGG